MNDHWSGNTLLSVCRMNFDAPRRSSNQRVMRFVITASAQCVEVRGDVARLARGHTEVRHVVAPHHALRILDPVLQVVRGVRQHPCDVAATAELDQRRADEPVGALDPRDGVAAPAAEVLDRALALVRAAARDGADLRVAARVATAEQQAETQRDGRDCRDARPRASPPRGHRITSIVGTMTGSPEGCLRSTACSHDANRTMPATMLANPPNAHMTTPAICWSASAADADPWMYAWYQGALALIIATPSSVPGNHAAATAKMPAPWRDLHPVHATTHQNANAVSRKLRCSSPCSSG